MAKKDIQGLPIPYGIKSPNKMANADGYYGTYDSLQDALDTVVLAIREPGRTVGIKENGKVVEYWWESTTDLSDEALVKKTTIYPIFTKTENGLVPAPNATTSTKFLREDGTWVVPTNTTYTAGTTAVLNTGTSATSQTWSAKVLTETFLPLNGTKEGKLMEGEFKIGEAVSFSLGNYSDITTAQYKRIVYGDMYDLASLITSFQMTPQGITQGVSSETSVTGVSLSKDGISYQYVNSVTEGRTQLILQDEEATFNVQLLRGVNGVQVDTEMAEIYSTGSVTYYMKVSQQGIEHSGSFISPTNFSNPSQRMSALPDKSVDVTYLDVLGMDELGNLGKIGGKAIVNKILDLPADSPEVLSLFYKLNGNFSSSARINTIGVFPPIVPKNSGNVQVTIMGSGLTLPEDDRVTQVELLDIENNNSYQVGFLNVSSNTLKVFINTNIYPISTYKIRIVSGVQAHITAETFEIKESQYVEDVDVNSLVWTRERNSAIPAETNITTLNFIDNLPNKIKINKAGTYGVASGRWVERITTNGLFQTGDDFMVEIDIYVKYQPHAGTGSNLNEYRNATSFGTLITGTAIPVTTMTVHSFGTGASNYFNANIHYWSTTNINWNLVSTAEHSKSYPNLEALEKCFIMKRGNTYYFVVNGWSTKKIITSSPLDLNFISSSSNATSTTLEFTINKITKFR